MPNRQHPWKIVFGILAATWMLVSITYNLLILISALDQLGDFGSFIASGIELRQGRNPYGTGSPLIFEAHFPLVETGGKLPNLNPPISLVFFKWLPENDLALTTNLWRMLSLAIYLMVILLLAVQYKPSALVILWSFSLAGLWHTLGLGQIYTPLLLLVTLIWINSLKEHQVRVGIFLGLLISFKPNFVLWLFLFIFTQNWTVIKSCLITILTVGIIPLLFMPSSIYVRWFDATRVDEKILAMPGNSSLIGLTSRIHQPEIGIGLIILLLLAVVILIHRARPGERQPQPELLNATAILLCLLASPISWAGYTILTLPIFFSRKEWGLPAILAAGMLTLPFNFTMTWYYLGSFNFIFWGWWYGLALMVCMITTLIKWQAAAPGRGASWQRPL